MAVVREEIIINEKRFMKNYSDKNFYIQRDGITYAEATDPIEFAEERQYEETDIPIEDDIIEDNVNEE